MDGHWEQLQCEVNRLILDRRINQKKESKFRVDVTIRQARELNFKMIVDELKGAVVNAATDAKFDFSKKVLKFDDDTSWLKVEKINSKLRYTF